MWRILFYHFPNCSNAQFVLFPKRQIIVHPIRQKKWCHFNFDHHHQLGLSVEYLPEHNGERNRLVSPSLHSHIAIIISVVLSLAHCVPYQEKCPSDDVFFVCSRLSTFQLHSFFVLLEKSVVARTIPFTHTSTTISPSISPVCHSAVWKCCKQL